MPAGSLPVRADRMVVVGVLNVTPDSFSDGGRYQTLDDALAHAREMRDDGADLIDVGGESTRPGAQRVPAEEEIRRVLPVVERLAGEGIPVSVDTYRARVAAAALQAGAAIVNDVSGGLGDPDMAAVVRDAGCPWILMHWRGHSASMQQLATYTDVVAEVRAELVERIDAAVAAGVDPGHLVIDPGLGFAKTGAHNWALLAQLGEFVSTGLPVLVGSSRKSFLGALLADADGLPRPVRDREDATTALTAYCALQGAWGVRVHEVRPSVDAALAMAAIEKANPAIGHRPKSQEEIRDRVTLTGLRVFGRHGVFEHERRDGQEFVIDVELELDISAAAASDELADTVDYGALAQRVAEIVGGDPVNLLETLAERIADACLGDERVIAVVVTVHKPHAPIPLQFGDVAVGVRRTRA